MKKISSILLLYLIAASSVSSSAQFGTHDQLQSPQQEQADHSLQVLAASQRNTTAAAIKCRYTIAVQTGSYVGAGTNARVSLVLQTTDRRDDLTVHDLQSWGAMAAGHDYFERGGLDVFEGRAECVRAEPCWMRLASDGSGFASDWYVSYVEVDVYPEAEAEGTPYRYRNHKFVVEQWIDEDFSAVRDECHNHAAMA